MERINGRDWVDIGGNKRGFRSQNAGTGVPGTEVTDTWLNNVQEEILKVIEATGIVASAADMTQLWQALNLMLLPGFAGRAEWMPVLSVTTLNPPAGPVAGDAYVIPAGATGAWAGQAQKLAIWTGSVWAIVTTRNGHGVGLPDGSVFTRRNGAYVELAARDDFKGLVELATRVEARTGTDTQRAVTPDGLRYAVRAGDAAVAGGTANALTATLAPALADYVRGLSIDLRITTTNTGPATLNVDDLGAREIRANESGDVLAGGELVAGMLARFVYNGAIWVVGNSAASAVNRGLVSLKQIKQESGAAALTALTRASSDFLASLANAVITAIAFVSFNSDGQGDFSFANGTLTCQRTGRYMMLGSFGAIVQSQQAAALSVGFRRNGAELMSSSLRLGNTSGSERIIDNLTGGAASVVDLVAGDTLTAWAFQDSVGQQYVRVVLSLTAYRLTAM